ncbi:carbohydrate ABC transporter membrane protein 2, CUT1 family [Caloramator quimbayensis]|uniref:Carbohydrate ABC transporter membrane protein 2, CUT1 family n=1 Tax=Caloramator quimbayensis TaxID=1147123 RepID=A0A1T4XPU9_9CLOT|nr:carbohydrate ABC transporter permease [Caloramator quimbayensis]SKA91148.1 carbohydrate ABC transporter membrane protein 2, CUT1 family [Caloramator quimbayensis]
MRSLATKKNYKSEKIRGIRIFTSSFSILFQLIIVAISILPIVWIFFSSFKTNGEILNSSLSLPKHWNFYGYINAFKISPLHKFYANSIIIAVTSTILNVFFVGMASYVIARFNFKFKKVILITLSLSLFLPMTSLIHPVYMTINKIGLYDTKAGLILVYTALGLPTTLFLLNSYFLSIPKDIEEAAYIDGAGFFRTFIQIIVPVARPGFATAAVLQFLLSWNEFLYAIVLTNSKENRTIPVALSYFTSQFSFNYTSLFAAIVMVSLPSIILFALMQEQVVSSLTAGSVKG